MPRKYGPAALIPSYHELETRLRDMQEKEAITPFCKEFCEALGLLAASTPMVRWPIEFQVAFRSVADKMPTAATIYKKRNKQLA